MANSERIVKFYKACFEMDFNIDAVTVRPNIKTLGGISASQMTHLKCLSVSTFFLIKVVQGSQVYTLTALELRVSKQMVSGWFLHQQIFHIWVF